MIQSPAGYQGDVRIKRYLDFYQAGYGVAMLSSGVAFSPLSLFANGEQGGWYDPSDLTTLFQDAAGTTPVTAVEQPVGLVLDKSKGLVLGSELVTNGDFSSSTGWTLGVGWTISGGTLNYAGGYNVSYFTAASNAFVAGRYYKVSLTISNNTSGNVVFYLNLPNNGILNGVNISGNGEKTFFLLAGVTCNGFHVVGNSATGAMSIDNISVRELPGNHLSQSTSTARPVLSARVNLLTYTEDFSDSVWAGAGSSITANTVAAPNGTQTADTLTRTATGAVEARRRYTTSQVASVEYTLSCYAKAGSSGAKLNLRNIAVDDTATSGVVQFDLSAGTVSTTYGSTYSGKAFITSAGNGWWHCRITGTTAASLAGRNLIDIATSDGASAIGGTSGEFIYIWGADLRPANAGVGLPAYQRVGASTDYDTTGFPLYLKFDGTDDFLVSGTINPGSVDKAQVFAGVRKLSDATLGMLAEYGPNVNGTLGTWGHILPDTTSAGSLGLDLCGNGSSGIQRVSTGTAPATFVSATGFDLSGTTYETERPTKRVNGAAATVLSSAGATDTGGGNFSSQALYIGRRAGTSLPFNGQLYSLILRFSATNMDAATIASTETWVNSKTGAY